MCYVSKISCLGQYISAPDLPELDSMQHSKFHVPQTFRRRCYLSSAAAATITLAIVIPIAVIFGMRSHQDMPRSEVIFPLYVYPAEAAWDPLYQAQENPSAEHLKRKANVTQHRAEPRNQLHPCNQPGQWPGRWFLARRQLHARAHKAKYPVPECQMHWLWLTFNSSFA